MFCLIREHDHRLPIFNRPTFVLFTKLQTLLNDFRSHVWHFSSWVALALCLLITVSRLASIRHSLRRSSAVCFLFLMYSRTNLRSSSVETRFRPDLGRERCLWGFSMCFKQSAIVECWRSIKFTILYYLKILFFDQFYRVFPLSSTLL